MSKYQICVAARVVAGGGGKGGEWCGRPRLQSPNGGKMTISIKKKGNFVRLTSFKLLNEVKQISISDCKFLKCVIFVAGIVIPSGLRKAWLPHWLQPFSKNLNFLNDKF